MRIQLSDNFFLDEFTFSDTAIRHGIDIVVEEGSIQFDRIKRFAVTIAQPLRNEVGRIDLASGYRPLEVNRLVGGSGRSQHIDALAGDLVPDKVTPLQLCEAAVALGLPFDQLIHEFGRWAHVSISKGSKPPRGDVLTSYRFNPRAGKAHVSYVPGLHTIESLWERTNGAD